MPVTNDDINDDVGTRGDGEDEAFGLGECPNGDEDEGDEDGYEAGVMASKRVFASDVCVF